MPLIRTVDDADGDCVLRNRDIEAGCFLLESHIDAIAFGEPHTSQIDTNWFWLSFYLWRGLYAPCV